MAKRSDVPFDDWPGDEPEELGNARGDQRTVASGHHGGLGAGARERMRGTLRKSALRRVPDGALGALAAVAVALVIACLVHWWPSPGGSGLAITTASEAVAASEAPRTTSDMAASEAPSAQGAAAQVTVDVAGAVASPGVYTFERGTRVIAAIEAAGGVTSDAQASSVNMARELQDGEQVYVPREGESRQGGAASSSGGSSAATASGGASKPSGGLVNINTATVADLEALPGIGPSTAQKIVSDRETNGPFASKEDLQRVSGIGEKKYAALADLICV